ncbi:TPM domain-containing protein [Macrococcus carouselicus]|uniref:TPM domain-containing protein n=1 Tax=Macrococcus carouselicus TaxID=69969 RepID=A0A9Q8CLT8_9STAP|nr:TPM domain-containing protein [Macrococcus carouselicus]TDM04555.1 TPM domain-containing protein [Macrococcus carouselicus]
MTQKIAFLFAIFVLLCPFYVANAAQPIPQLEKPVYTQDHLDIFNQNQVSELNELGNRLEQGTTAEILMMTMPSIGQEPRTDYALRAGREYGVGQKDKDNGIVILLNLDNGNEFRNRGITVQVGYGLEGVLNDAKVGALIDQYAMPDIQRAVAIDPTGQDSQAKQLYASGMTKLYKAVWNVIADSYGYDGSKFTRDQPVAQEQSTGGFSVFDVLLTLFFLYLIFSMFFGGGGRGGGPGGRRRRGGIGPVIFFPTGGGFGGGFSSGGGFGGDGGFGGGFGGGGFGGGGADRGF